MFYHYIYITYTIKVGFTRWINNYNEQQINTVSHKVIDNIIIFKKILKISEKLEIFF